MTTPVAPDYTGMFLTVLLSGVGTALYWAFVETAWGWLFAAIALVSLIIPSRRVRRR